MTVARRTLLAGHRRRLGHNMTRSRQIPRAILGGELLSRKQAKGNKVLIITYVFPPVAYVGGYRTLKYCKYLSDYGWTPLVLTARATGATFRDENLLRQVPAHVRVYRTLDIDPEKWEAKLADWKAIVVRPGRMQPDTPDYSITPKRETQQQVYGLWARMKAFVKALLKGSPDSHIFWAPSALLRGSWLLLTEQVDVVYCSSPPHSSHIIAYLLAKCFRKPYVLDFRDPWYVSGSVRSPSDKLSWLLKLETFAKRVIVTNAAKVISVSSGERGELRDEFPEIGEEHFTFITNGYDPADIGDVSVGKRTPGRLTLIHAGTLYSGIAEEFLAALQQLVRDHLDASERIQVLLLGDIAYEYNRAVQTLQATGILKAYGFRPHAEAMKMVNESDVLVILMGGTKFLPSHIPAKVFEYLDAGKPILAIVREGELAQIVTKSGLGIVVSPDSIDGLAQALWGLSEDHAAGRLARTPNRPYIKSFERAALTEKLAGILDEVKGACGVRH